MAQDINKPTTARIISGISDYDKESVLPGAVAWMRSIDFRSDPRKFTILPRTVKESGLVYEGLPKWFTPRSTTGYIYDANGNLYERSSAGSHSKIRTVSTSHGNGLAYYGEDDFVYYTGDKTIGRYGQFSSGSPAFADDFLTSQGGVPTNTKSVDLEAGSSEYMSVADSAALSITGDIAIEIYFKPESLPTVGNSMTLVSKWNEQSDERSYRFDIYAISGYFGDGSNSSRTVSSTADEAPTDSSATGTLDSYSLTATNASFAAGQVILIIQMQGTGAGTWQRTKIASYTAGTITTEDQLNFSYNSTSGNNKAQVLVMPQYTSVTVNSGITWGAKAWNGTVGGILAFLCNGVFTNNGTVTAASRGFRGGIKFQSGTGGQNIAQQYGYTGEGTGGASFKASNRNPNGNGAGASGAGTDGNHSCSGSGGENAGGATEANSQNGGLGGIKGEVVGSADLTTMCLGGGGSGKSSHGTSTIGTDGAPGGGILVFFTTTLTNNGTISANGGTAANATDRGAGGGGAGGSILMRVQTATLGTMTAIGGNGGGGNVPPSGNGGAGRIHIDYLTSYSGTTTPTIDATQDNTLVTTTTYQLRLSLSSNGTNEEFLTKNAPITLDEWNHAAFSWDASEATVEFMYNGSSLGSSFGSFTSIYNGTAVYAIGADFNSSGAARNFLDAKVDESRLWNVERSVAQVFANKDVELLGNEAGLIAYHSYDDSLSDSSANGHNLTHSSSAVYSTDVPFSAPTTRLDIDQEDTSTGQTYALGTSIDEGASHRQTFAPNRDPQKSISINIADLGDNGDWTLTVHDALNRVVATKTVARANLPTSGVYEFVFDSTWRPVLGANYHFHLTVSSATGSPAVVSGTTNNLETAQFKSYYQFLVTDVEWHPLMHYANLLVIGNERYLAVWNASSFNPHRLKFPSGHRVRAFGVWNGYLAIGCMLGATISETEQGRIFFWDGFSDTYNDFIDVPEGGINAMLGSVGELHFIAGYQGDYLVYNGGRKARKKKRLPKITSAKEIEVYPGAMTMWQALMRIGVAGGGDSDVVEKGVYTRGSLNELYPESFSYDYPISTGNRLSTVKVGMTAAVGKKLLIGWQDGVAYGVDVVDPAGAPYPTARIELLIDDQGGVWKEKILSTIRADVLPMETGESVTIQYKLDRDTWENMDTTENEDRSVVRGASINGSRHREYQLAIDLNTSVSTAPSLLALTPEEDLNTEETIT